VGKGFVHAQTRNPLFALPSILRFINYHVRIKLHGTKPGDDPDSLG
jgi:hypothetical protein